MMPVRRSISNFKDTAAIKGGGFGKSRFGPDSASSDISKHGGGASTTVYQGMQFDDHRRPIGKAAVGGAVRGGSAMTQQQQQQQPTSTAATTILQVSKCKYQYFGCPIFPSELSSLKATSSNIYYPSHASSSHIMITHKSNRSKPQVNQDRAVLLPSYVYSMYTRSRNDTIDAVIDSRDDFFLGIFDGHGTNGHRVAQFAAEEIPSRLASKMMSSTTNKYDDDKEGSISEELITEVYKEVDKVITIKDAGSTASIIVRIGQQLYMANTGDSTSYICIYEPPPSYNKDITQANKLYITKKRDGLPDRYGHELQQLHLQGTVTIYNQNTQHKPHLSSEQSRIENAGGQIIIDSRLKMKKNNNNNWSRIAVGSNELAMSRSIGDVEFASVGVIPDPDITVINLQEFWSEHDIVDDNDGSSTPGKKVFVVLGSDGLFDSRKVEYVAQHVAYGLFEWGQGWGQRNDDLTNTDIQRKFSAHLLDVGRKLVDMASPVKSSSYRDDISFIAKRIELQN
jgi:serine/threonine protein phosphatase PrpC